MWPNPQFAGDLVTFTEKILNGKLHFCAMGDNFSSKTSKNFKNWLFKQYFLKMNFQKILFNFKEVLGLVSLKNS